MRPLFVRVLLLAFLVPAGGAAQSLPLTEAQALERLSPESPRVRAIRAPVELARADVLAAGRWPNPRLTVNREAVAGVTEYITTIAQPLPVTGRRALEVRAASALVDASAGRADDLVRRARADLRLAFADLRFAQVREAELMRARDRLRDLAGILARREAAGDAAGFDRLRAEREVLDVDADLSLAAVERLRAQAALAGFLGERVEPGTVVAASQPTVAAPLPSLDELLARAETVRGELAALQRELDAATLAERAAARRLIPEPEVVGGTKSSTFGAGDLGGVIAVHASLPLFDRAVPERAAARARSAGARARADAFRLELRTRLAGLRAAIEERRALADRYRTGAVAGADEVARIAQVSYDAGERGILELLDAFRTSSAARVRQAALEAGVREAEIELEFVSGWEIP